MIRFPKKSKWLDGHMNNYKIATMASYKTNKLTNVSFCTAYNILARASTLQNNYDENNDDDNNNNNSNCGNNEDNNNYDFNKK